MYYSNMKSWHYSTETIISPYCQLKDCSCNHYTASLWCRWWYCHHIMKLSFLSNNNWLRSKLNLLDLKIYLVDGDDVVGQKQSHKQLEKRCFLNIFRSRLKITDHTDYFKKYFCFLLVSHSHLKKTVIINKRSGNVTLEQCNWLSR